jgi:hypothetical protein
MTHARAHETLTRFREEIRFLDLPLGRVDVRRVNGRAAVTRVEDGGESATRLKVCQLFNVNARLN